MTLAVAEAPALLEGIQTPRIAPPLPLRTRMDEYRAFATCMGITLMPWQNDHAAQYMMAVGPDGGWLYPESATIVARRNGKTELLKPRIHDDLDRGRTVIHTSQNRSLPRQTYMGIGLHYVTCHPEQVVHFWQGSGQEELLLTNGGIYTIVAPQRGSRGLGADTFIFDELREFETDDIQAAAVPTLASSNDPQRIYLSNAGSDASVILNDLKRRGEEGGDEHLAYVEWSAHPDRSVDDRLGWAEANPSMGRPEHPAGMRLQKTLEEFFHSLSPSVFETEHLCRWVASMQPRAISEAAWAACHASIEVDPIRPSIAFSMDPSGRRASAVMAWQMTDGRIACVEIMEAVGDPIDVKALGSDLMELTRRYSARKVAHASWTDKDIARYIPKSEAVDGKEYANASENFARVVNQGRLAWDGAEHITSDVPWAARKPHPESGAWMVVPASTDRSITAFLAAVRAVWLASAPKPSLPRIG